MWLSSLECRSIAFTSMFMFGFFLPPFFPWPLCALFPVPLLFLDLRMAGLLKLASSRGEFRGLSLSWNPRPAIILMSTVSIPSAFYGANAVIISFFGVTFLLPLPNRFCLELLDPFLAPGPSSPCRKACIFCSISFLNFSCMALTTSGIRVVSMTS